MFSLDYIKHINAPRQEAASLAEPTPEERRHDPIKYVCKPIEKFPIDASPPDEPDANTPGEPDPGEPDPGAPWRVARGEKITKNAQSQKVRGLLAIGTVRVNGGGGYSPPRDTWHFIRAADLVEYHKRTGGREMDTARSDTYLLPRRPDGSPQMTYRAGLFIRPCPVTPRHGFVDSREVHTPNELISVARETVEADPDGELLLTQFIPAEASAVLTPSMLSFGRGHDGATSGKSVTIYGPALEEKRIAEITAAASIAPGDIPYVELVYQSDIDFHTPATIVQVRGGPEQMSTTDFVPAPVTVRAVLTAAHDIDLLRWEKQVADAAPGTVIHAPDMGLAAHQCIHAIINNVPVLTSRAPVIGETLEVTNTPKWTGKDFKRLARFMREADRYFSPDNADNFSARLAVAALHCAGAPAPATDAQCRLLAYGAVAAAKHLAAAVLGEARHATSASNRFDGSRSTRADRAVGAIGRIYDDEDCSTRETFYRHAFKSSVPALAQALFALVPVFRDRAWSRSYGGKRWASINAGARKLLNAINTFDRSPTQKNWAQVVQAWNIAITREHNGKAPALSKWCLDTEFMTRAARWPIACAGTLSPRILKVICHGANTKGSTLVGPAPKYQRRGKPVSETRACLVRRDRTDEGHLVLRVDHRFSRRRVVAIPWDEATSVTQVLNKLAAGAHGLDVVIFDSKRYLPAHLVSKSDGIARVKVPQAIRTLYKVLDVSIPAGVAALRDDPPQFLYVEGFKKIALPPAAVNFHLGAC